MQIDRHVELFGARIDRPEPLVIEKDAVGETMHHGALEAELFGGALQLVGGGVRHRGGQCGEAGKALLVA